MLSVHHLLTQLFVEVGSKCALFCKHCSTMASPSGMEAIPLDRLYWLVDEGVALGLKKLTISGGEPLLYEESFKLSEYAIKKGIDVTIYSCGVFFDGERRSPIGEDVFNNLKRIGVKNLIFSLHGNEKIQDYITGIKGSYKIVTKSIRIAVEKGFNVEIHTVPTALNFNKLEGIVLTALELGVKKVSFLRVVPQGRLNEFPELILTRDQEKLLSSKLNRISKQYDIRLGSPWGCVTGDHKVKCTAGLNKILIGSNGNVYPCEAFKGALRNKEDVSNILFDGMGLKKIWEGDRYLNLVRELNKHHLDVEGCMECDKYRICHGGCHGQRLLRYDTISQGPDPGCVYNN